MALTAAENELLTFVADLPKPTSPEAQAKLYARFGNLTRVWQVLNAVIDTADANALHPGICAHLRRVRARRTVRPADAQRI